MKTSRQRKRRSAPGDVAPPGQQYSDRECIRWLLEFLRCDLAALRPRELLVLRNEVFPYLHDKSRAAVTSSRGRVACARARLTETTWRGVLASHRCRPRAHGRGTGRTSGRRQRTAGGMWHPFGRQGPAPAWSFKRGDDGAIVRIYLGKWRPITVASAADVLVRWWPELRRCKHEPCATWFLPTHGRQWYHDARCASAARYQRFKPTRNYKAEYARRHDSTRPPARPHPSGRRSGADTRQCRGQARWSTEWSSRRHGASQARPAAWHL